MNKDNKALLKQLGIIFLVVILTYKIPYDSYSLLQYAIRPIRFGSGVLHLAGLVALVLLFVGIKGLFNLERFAGKSKLVIFLVVVFLLMPVMKTSLDTARTMYHWAFNDELQALDLAEADVTLNLADDEAVINVNLAVVNYSRDTNRFKVRVFLPELWQATLGQEYLELGEEYLTYGSRQTTNIGRQITVELESNSAQEDIRNSQWFRETFEYELYNEREVVRIIDRGI